MVINTKLFLFGSVLVLSRAPFAGAKTHFVPSIRPKINCKSEKWFRWWALWKIYCNVTINLFLDVTIWELITPVKNEALGLPVSAGRKILIRSHELAIKKSNKIQFDTPITHSVNLMFQFPIRPVILNGWPIHSNLPRSPFLANDTEWAD